MRRPTLDEVLDGAITLGVSVLMLVGFAVSWATLSHLALTAGHFPPELAWAVPLSFDLGIITLSLKVVRAAREGRTAPVLRLLVVTLSVITVAANATAASDPAGVLLHVVPPAMFVVAFESIVATTRRHALVRLGLVPPQLPRVRGVRWLLAPWPTFTAWRSAVLARDLFEHDEAERLGQVEPVEVAEALTAAVGDRPQTARTTSRRRQPNRPAESSTAVDVAGIAAELHRAGGLSRRALTRAVREAGGSIGTDRADEVIREITRPVPIAMPRLEATP